MFQDKVSKYKQGDTNGRQQRMAHQLCFCVSNVIKIRYFDPLQPHEHLKHPIQSDGRIYFLIIDISAKSQFILFTLFGLRNKMTSNKRKSQFHWVLKLLKDADWDFVAEYNTVWLIFTILLGLNHVIIFGYFFVLFGRGWGGGGVMTHSRNVSSHVDANIAGEGL